MVNNVFLALGSNIGNRQEYLEKAINLIKNNSDIGFVSASPVYLTKAYGITEQSDFYNCVCDIKTSLSPLELLNFCKECETNIGRTKTEKWGPRKIDVDILFYNDLVLNTEILTIPHKEFVKRDFFVLPMSDIAPNFVYPGLNLTVTEILNEIKEKYIIEKLNINI